MPTGRHGTVVAQQPNVSVAREKSIAFLRTCLTVVRSEESLNRENRVEVVAKVFLTLKPPVGSLHTAAALAPGTLGAG